MRINNYRFPIELCGFNKSFQIVGHYQVFVVVIGNNNIKFLSNSITEICSAY